MKKYILAFGLMVIPSISLAAWHGASSTTIWAIDPTATAGNLNGGGCDPTYETNENCASIFQQAAELTVTDMVIGADPKTVSSVASPFLSTHTGYSLNITAGTGFLLRWVKIMSVSVGVATLDAAAGVAASVGGTGRVGGGLSMNTVVDDDFFEMLQGGNTVYVKASGDIPLGESVSVATSASPSNPINIIGYSSTILDAPTGDSRPRFNHTTTNDLFGDYYNQENIRHVGTGTTVLNTGVGSRLKNVKFQNGSAAAQRIAVTLGASSKSSYIEATSSVGIAVNFGGVGGANLSKSYVHESSNCIFMATADDNVVSETLLSVCNSTGIGMGSTSAHHTIIYNTIAGTMSIAGTDATKSAGLWFGTGNSINHIIYGNIFYGWGTAIKASSSTFLIASVIDRNNFFNNNQNISTGTVLNSSNFYVDPQFTDVIHEDFRIGTNLKALGFPEGFGASPTVSYIDIGAVQRQEQGSSGTRSYPIGN